MVIHPYARNLVTWIQKSRGLGFTRDKDSGIVIITCARIRAVQGNATKRAADGSYPGMTTWICETRSLNGAQLRPEGNGYIWDYVTDHSTFAKAVRWLHQGQ